ncbi:MAG TPA: histidine phosphatase family protein [Pseudomonadales bacterium]|nr:histidine phosphatase family protein [Pseudomonadales bacterium]
MSADLRLLLLRHGAALPSGPDPELSPRGCDEVEAVLRGRGLADLGERPLILHSPLRRAVRTAELVARRWPLGQRHLTDLLLPEASVAEAARTVLAADRTHADALVVVSHLPLLPALARWLCEADCRFETGSGWLLTADADMAWQGSFEVLRAIKREQGCGPADGEGS